MALDEVKDGRGVGFRIFIMVVIVGYVMTYGAFGTDPGWNPGLNEMEALAEPGRSFFVFYYGENDWVYVDVDDLWHVVAGR